MAIGYGQLGVGALNDYQAAGSVTSAAVNTSVSGSSFLVYVVVKSPVLGGPYTITDNKGNVYTQVGSPVNDGTVFSILRYLCTNGAGGSGHTVTVTNPGFGTGTVTAVTSTSFTDSSKSYTANAFVGDYAFNITRLQYAVCTSNSTTVMNFSAVPAGTAIGDSYVIGAIKATVILLEITGGANSSLFDQGNQNGGYLNSPQSPGSITLGAEAANGALLISAYEVGDFATISYAESTGFTILYSYTLGSSYPNNITFALGYKLVSGAGTYTPSWSGGGQAYAALTVDSFLAPSSLGAVLATSLGAVAALTPMVSTTATFQPIPLLTNLTPANTGNSQTAQTVGGYLNTAFGYINGGRNVFAQEVTYALTATVDSPIIAGDSPGYSNSYSITPSGSGFTLNGLNVASGASMQNGFTRVITNMSPTYSFNLGHSASGTTANRFLCPNGVPVTIFPYGSVTVRYSAALAGSVVK